jgi:heat-inducible transcriptional repressor
MGHRANLEMLRKPDLSSRQATVLRAMVTAYLGEGAPIGSATVSHLLPVNLSSASIRYTMAELAELGLIEKPHASAGRLPTERGLRVFVDELLDPGHLAVYEQRALAYSVDEVEAEEVATVTSQLLSEHTRLLGFVVTPRIDRVELRHVSLVRVSTERLLVVLVSKTGTAQRRIVEDKAGLDQAELDRIAVLLNERVAGRTLPEVRELLAREAKALRHEADRLLARAFELGARVLAEQGDAADLVITTRLALLDQPEFRDPRRVRDLFAAIEAKEHLLELLDRLLEGEGVRIAFGEEVDEPALQRCALVATPYGGEQPLGALGVIGPSRMDYGRVIALVAYLSRVVTEKLNS